MSYHVRPAGHTGPELGPHLCVALLLLLLLQLELPEDQICQRTSQAQQP